MKSFTMTDQDVNAFIRGCGVQCFENDGSVSSNQVTGTRFQMYLKLRCMDVKSQRAVTVKMSESGFLPSYQTGEDFVQFYGSDLKPYDIPYPSWDVFNITADSVELYPSI